MKIFVFFYENLFNKMHGMFPVFLFFLPTVHKPKFLQKQKKKVFSQNSIISPLYLLINKCTLLKLLHIISSSLTDFDSEEKVLLS